MIDRVINYGNELVNSLILWKNIVPPPPLCASLHVEWIDVSIGNLIEIIILFENKFIVNNYQASEI